MNLETLERDFIICPRCGNPICFRTPDEKNFTLASAHYYFSHPKVTNKTQLATELAASFATPTYREAIPFIMNEEKKQGNEDWVPILEDAKKNAQEQMKNMANRKPDEPTNSDGSLDIFFRNL